jgi:hypothetical protein
MTNKSTITDLDRYMQYNPRLMQAQQLFLAARQNYLLEVRRAEMEIFKLTEMRRKHAEGGSMFHRRQAE